MTSFFVGDRFQPPFLHMYKVMKESFSKLMHSYTQIWAFDLKKDKETFTEVFPLNPFPCCLLATLKYSADCQS